MEKNTRTHCGEDGSTMGCLHEIKIDIADLKETQKQHDDDMYLVKHALDIKELQNGERDKQIEYAKERINVVGKETEDKDSTLAQRIIDTQLNVAELTGYFRAIIAILMILMALLINHIFGIVG